MPQIGGCPRIVIFSQIEEYEINCHRHIVDIPRIVFEHDKELREKDILGQPPKFW